MNENVVCKIRVFFDREAVCKIVGARTNVPLSIRALAATCYYLGKLGYSAEDALAFLEDLEGRVLPSLADVSEYKVGQLLQRNDVAIRAIRNKEEKFLCILCAGLWSTGNSKIHKVYQLIQELRSLDSFSPIVELRSLSV